MIIEFYDVKDYFLMDIKAPLRRIRKELNNYRNHDKYYSDEGWLKWLKSQGIKAKIITAEHIIYF